MKIRRASAQHLDRIVELNKQFHLDIPLFRWDTPEWVREELRHYHVAENESTVVGAICTVCGPSVASMETISVDKAAQGKGLGKLLINFACGYAKNKGMSQITVESFCAYNLEEFYLACGFTKLPEQKMFQGMPYNCYLRPL